MTDGVPEPPANPGGGEPAEPAAVRRIEDALGRLDGLAERPVAEHAAAFEELHTVLVEALSTVEPAADEV
jgi:hypothetical protein